MVNFHNKFILSALLALCCQTPVFAYKTHHVASGESIWGISKKYDISVEQLIAANPSLEKGLKAGTDIRIPEPSDLNNTADVDQQADADADTRSHVVRINRNNTANSQSAQSADTPPIEDGPISFEPAASVADPAVNGYYTSSFGDSFTSISKKNNVPVDTLIRLNPFIDPTTIPEGTIVRISSRPIDIIDDRNLTYIDSIELRILAEPVQFQGNNVSATDIIVIALPFELETEGLTKQSLLATEFYKGMLLAFNSQLSRGNIAPFKVVVIDTKPGVEKVVRQINDLNLNNTSIIIPAEDEALLTAIANSGCPATVLNVLSIRDNSYVDNPSVIQCNISQPLMYDKAASYITDHLQGYTPVILNPSSGASEKAGFIDALRKKCEDQGIEIIDLNFSNKLTVKDLARLSKDKKYVFIPKSGNTEVFEKFSGALTEYFETDSGFERLKLFGYPDWVVMKGSNEKALHDMNATIYSRFYLDEQNIFTKDILDAFEKWYGSPMAKAFPMQAMLGYDAANLIINAQGKKWAQSAFDRFDGNAYEGEQSAFHFIHDNSTGIINDALYIIEFLPGESCIITVI